MESVPWAFQLCVQMWHRDSQLSYWKLPVWVWVHVLLALLKRSNNACAVCEGRITKKKVLLATEKRLWISSKRHHAIYSAIMARARVSWQVSPDLPLAIVHNHYWEWIHVLPSIIVWGILGLWCIGKREESPISHSNALQPAISRRLWALSKSVTGSLSME